MFYTFRQNNSGGSFDIDGEVSLYVIIEAKNADEADRLAQERASIYFNGCDEGLDCPCCGDRWSMQYDDNDGTESPEIYGKPAAEYTEELWVRKGEVYCYVYYLDGTVEKHVR